jgi:hypothetical protein
MFKKLIHGIDMSAPGAVEDLLAFHRLTFGDAVMQDPPGTPPAGTPPADPPADPAGTPPAGTPPADPPGTPPAGDPPPADPPAGDPPGTEALGDAGKRALDTMKAKVQTEKAKRIAAEQRIAELTAPKAGDELTPEQLKEQIRAEVAAEFKLPLLKSSIKAAAAGFHDPTDAVLHLDLTQFEADENNEFDADEISAALTDLLAKKPWLGKTTGQPGDPRIPTVPAPPANGKHTPTSLDDQIAAASKAGDSMLELRLQNQKLAEKAK